MTMGFDLDNFLNSGLGDIGTEVLKGFQEGNKRVSDQATEAYREATERLGEQASENIVIDCTSGDVREDLFFAVPDCIMDGDVVVANRLAQKHRYAGEKPTAVFDIDNIVDI